MYYHFLGSTNKAIADCLRVSKSYVTKVISADRYKDNLVPPCPFCKSDKTMLSSTNNRNPGREGVMYYVRCNKCYAKGPRVTYFDRDKGVIDERVVKAQAISLWEV